MRLTEPSLNPWRSLQQQAMAPDFGKPFFVTTAASIEHGHALAGHGLRNSHWVAYLLTCLERQQHALRKSLEKSSCGLPIPVWFPKISMDFILGLPAARVCHSIYERSGNIHPFHNYSSSMPAEMRHPKLLQITAQSSTVPWKASLLASA